MKDTVFVIGGGQWQEPIVRKAKDMGYKVVCSNLYEETAGSRAADYFEQADVRDIESNLSIARKYKPVAVVTDQSDIAVQTVSVVNQSLGLRGVSPGRAELFTDKLLMRKAAVLAGIKCPEFIEVKAKEDMLKAKEHLGLPFILKPRKSQSSRGVVIINETGDLDAAYEESMQHSDGLSLIAEEYIAGLEVTVEGYRFVDGHVSLACSEKQSFEHNRAIAARLIYPANLSPGDVSFLYRNNDRLVDSLNPEFGITHAEYMYKDGEFYLVEIAIRGGGTKISSHIIPFMSGVDVSFHLLKDAAGERQNRPLEVLPENRYCSLSFFQFDEGLAVSRTPETEVLDQRGVIDFSYSFDLNQRLPKVRDDRSRHAYMICCADSYKNLSGVEQLIRSKVEVCYE